MLLPEPARRFNGAVQSFTVGNSFIDALANGVSKGLVIVVASELNRAAATVFVPIATRFWTIPHAPAINLVGDLCRLPAIRLRRFKRRKILTKCLVQACRGIIQILLQSSEV